MASPLSYDPKDPDDIDDFTVDWSRVLATGETISTATATIVTGAVAVSGAVTISGSQTIARLTSGTLGEEATVRYRVVTSTGRQLDQTIWFKLETR